MSVTVMRFAAHIVTVVCLLWRLFVVTVGMEEIAVCGWGDSRPCGPSPYKAELFRVIKVEPSM